MTRLTTLGYAALFFSASLTSSASAQSIRWETAHPFRFFQYGSDFSIHQWAYDQLSSEERRDHPVSAVERKLNNPKWWDNKDASGKTRLELLQALRAKEKRKFVAHEPQLGWASLLRRDTNDTCWSMEDQLHRDCDAPSVKVTPASTYLEPRAFLVNVWFEGGVQAQICRWIAGKKIFRELDQSNAQLAASATAPCDRTVTIVVSSEEGAEITLSRDGAADLKQKIVVTNYLIVALGDSMSSGEGNPDVPVDLDPVRSVAPAFDAKKLRNDEPEFSNELGLPRRKDLAEPANWLDRRCHRSAYSYQLRAALAVALTQPRHHVVTFLSFACSGSEVLEGLLYEWKGREVISEKSLSGPGRARLNRPQLDAVVDELCTDPASSPRELKPGGSLDPNDEWVKDNDVPFDRVSLRFCPKDKMRPIDLLLLNIGVNDIGFSRLIANMMVTNGVGPYSASLVRKGAKVIDFGVAKTKAEQLSARFQMLKAAIESRVKLRDDDKSRIVFAGYPSLVSLDSAGHVCPKGRDGMTVSEIFEVKDANVIKQADDFTEKDFTPKLKQYTQGWTFVDDHRNSFRGHGYCATGGGINESGAGTADVLAMPYLPLTSGPGFLVWQYFSPVTQFYPYESRARWFRTFNDDYLLINYSDRNIPLTADQGQFANPIDLAQIPRGGPMHPTAEGHAHIADAITNAARTKLGLRTDGMQ